MTITAPDHDEVMLLACGVCTAIAPATGLTRLQQSLVTATFEALTDQVIDPADLVHCDPAKLAAALAERTLDFRTRIVQLMVLGELVLVPLPADVPERIAAFATLAGVEDTMLRIARDFATGSAELARLDFERNCYVPDPDVRADVLEIPADEVEEGAWVTLHDPALAARWEALGDLPEGSLGRAVFCFYRARGFDFPGNPGSAPPLLAQHDWVHVLADYGTTVECELEVFAFIAWANQDPRAFSLLAMVVSLFETGYLSQGAGLFEASAGHLSHAGVTVRMADAMRRGALCRVGASGVDFMAVDWFDFARWGVDDVRHWFGVTPRSQAALGAGSIGPWQHGGISPFQLAAGQAQADRDGRPYEGFGADPA